MTCPLHPGSYPVAMTCATFDHNSFSLSSCWNVWEATLQLWNPAFLPTHFHSDVILRFQFSVTFPLCTGWWGLKIYIYTHRETLGHLTLVYFYCLAMHIACLACSGPSVFISDCIAIRLPELIFKMLTLGNVLLLKKNQLWGGVIVPKMKQSCSKVQKRFLHLIPQNWLLTMTCF